MAMGNASSGTEDGLHGPTEGIDAGCGMSYGYASAPSLSVAFSLHFLTILSLRLLLPQ